MTSREELLGLAAGSAWPVLDLSQGVPAEPAPRIPAAALPSSAGVVAAYPPSAGTPELTTAARGYLGRRFGAPDSTVAACAGAKEFIGSLPLFLRLLRGTVRDTVLVPALGYPTYAFGIRMAGLQTYRVPADEAFRMRLDSLPAAVVARAMLLWVNSPSNPTGAVEDLPAVVAWGRAHGVVVGSDEAYAETNWTTEPRSILQSGADGVLAVHSLSKRSNAPGLRVGIYAGDPVLVAGLVRLRREAGLIASAEAQDAAAYLLADDRHAELLRERNRIRVTELTAAVKAHGFVCAAPAGGLYAWVSAPGGGDALARLAATEAGLVIRPGLDYGPAGSEHVRIAAVRNLAEVAPRLLALRHALDLPRSARAQL